MEYEVKLDNTVKYNYYLDSGYIKEKRKLDGLFEDRLTTLIALTSSFENFYRKWNQLEFELTKDHDFTVNFIFFE